MGYLSGCLGSVQPLYSGPGDIVAGAVGFWGLRSYSKASIGHRTIQLRRDSDNAARDFSTVQGGVLPLTAITGFAGSANLFVSAIYDQVDSLDLSQATAANQPQFIIVAGRPLLRYNGTTHTLGSAGTLTLAQPLTMSAVADRTANFTSIMAVLCAQDLSISIGPAGVADRWALGATNAVALDNVMHAGQSVRNGASSDLNIDGTSNAANSASTFSAAIVEWGSSLNFFAGDTLEVGIWPIAFSGGQSSSMSVNQHGFWVF